MSAARLREAARVLRERAEAATPGPWMVDGSQVYPTAHGAPLVAATRTHSLSDTPDAAYIATVDPLVALALADWLDDTADMAKYHARHALAVADAILGEAS